MTGLLRRPKPIKFELGIKKMIEDFMVQRMADNDKIVTRYMDDKDFQSIVFPLLAKEIFITLQNKEAEVKGADIE